MKLGKGCKGKLGKAFLTALNIRYTQFLLFDKADL
jgi:hypothetical protein